MQDTKPTPLKGEGNARDHLANERTFLAWTRTAIGVMAFGFVVVKFSLFIRQIAVVLQKDIAIPQNRYSSVIGIFIVAFGALLGVFSYFRFNNVQRQLDDNNFHPSKILTAILAAFIFLMGVAMVAYLIHSV